jgi:OOP family OmpA-OmpF porin
MTIIRRIVPVALALASVFAFSAAQAQTGMYPNRSGTGLMPGTSSGWVGISVGKSKYNINNGTNVYRSDDSDTAFTLSTGAMINQNFGVELGYNHMGDINRAGGSTKAQGIDLAGIAKAPLGAGFGIFGKLGTTYGWTRTSTGVGSGINGGKDHGFGLLYGVGASYDFTPQLSATLEFDSRDYHFAGTGRDAVRATTVGLQYRY